MLASWMEQGWFLYHPFGLTLKTTEFNVVFAVNGLADGWDVYPKDGTAAEPKVAHRPLSRKFSCLLSSLVAVVGATRISATLPVFL